MLSKRLSKKSMEHALILHNIRSAHNVGSIFRTADAARISKVYLTGITPTPVDRFGRPQKEIQKTALGAERFIPWEHFSKIGTLLLELKKRGFSLIAVEQTRNARDYKKTRLTKPTAFIFGSEVRGISPSIIKKCDKVIAISMGGKKESLNVSVAAGITPFRVLNR